MKVQLGDTILFNERERPVRGIGSEHYLIPFHGMGEKIDISPFIYTGDVDATRWKEKGYKIDFGQMNLGDPYIWVPESSVIVDDSILSSVLREIKREIGI